VLFRCIGRANEQRLRYLESIACISLASFEAVGAPFQEYSSLSMVLGQGIGRGATAMASQVCYLRIDYLTSPSLKKIMSLRWSEGGRGHALDAAATDLELPPALVAGRGPAAHRHRPTGLRPSSTSHRVRSKRLCWVTTLTCRLISARLSLHHHHQGSWLVGHGAPDPRRLPPDARRGSQAVGAAVPGGGGGVGDAGPQGAHDVPGRKAPVLLQPRGHQSRDLPRHDQGGPRGLARGQPGLRTVRAWRETEIASYPDGV
jgi:hypothetical protein